MKFSYKARGQDGSAQSGEIEATDRSDAIAKLRGSGVHLVSLDEKKKGGALNISFGSSVKLSDKILFTKNMAGMLRAGLSLSRALQVIIKQTKNAYFKKVISTLSDTIDKGETFSNGLEKFPKVFSPLFIAMVRAGEESGSLPKTLLEIGATLEKSYALNKKVKSAMMYPSIILIAIFIIAILMFVYVVPTLTKTFKELGGELPGSTKFVIGLSDLISNHIILIIIGVIVVGILGYMGSKIKSVIRAFDWTIVRLPVIGGIVREVNTARTTRTLSSLLGSGVPISRAISITKEVLQNVYYKEVMVDVEAAVQKGSPISTVFKEQGTLYPVMMSEMIEVGEETGSLGTMLLEVATFYEGEVDAKTKDLSTIIEPVLMIFIGGAVGFFAISMLQPMYSIMDSIK